MQAEAKSSDLLPDNLLFIFPDPHFPIGQIFEVPDQFNGPRFGTFYFRSPLISGFPLRGPFKSREAAELFFQHEANDCA